jgi:hypothetical protein
MDDVELNQSAQKIVPLAEAVTRFKHLNPAEQRSVLERLAQMVHQASSLPDDVDVVAVEWNVSASTSPMVMLRRKPFASAWRQLLRLPAEENVNLFAALIGLLGVSDGRRREHQPDCRAGICRHWWHHDISTRELALLAKSQCDRCG